MTSLDVVIAGRSLRIKVRPNPRARRLILRIDRRSGQPVVTVPPGVSHRETQAFIEKSSGWLVHNLQTQHDVKSFDPGQTIPLRGVSHRIIHTDKQNRPVVLQDGEIWVKGAKEHFARRLTDWLRAEARADLVQCVGVHSTSLGAVPGRITVRDTTSRWGSCSARGSLSFSWRLILAPPDVLDYVAAHEVAHLKEMNHSPHFWRHVEALLPAYEAPRKWLKSNGSGLHAYGRTPTPSPRDQTLI